MKHHTQDDLWRDFPKTATEFEARFATEEDCREYWIEARWGGNPTCARCRSTRVWTERDGFLLVVSRSWWRIGSGVISGLNIPQAKPAVSSRRWRQRQCRRIQQMC